MKFINRFTVAANAVFKIPTAKQLAIIELEEAKREHLQMLTAQDYSRKMVEYHADRIRRLAAYVAKAEEEAKTEAV